MGRSRAHRRDGGPELSFARAVKGERVRPSRSSRWPVARTSAATGTPTSPRIRALPAAAPDGEVLALLDEKRVRYRGGARLAPGRERRCSRTRTATCTGSGLPQAPARGPRRARAPGVRGGAVHEDDLGHGQPGPDGGRRAVSARWPRRIRGPRTCARTTSRWRSAGTAAFTTTTAPSGRSAASAPRAPTSPPWASGPRVVGARALAAAEGEPVRLHVLAGLGTWRVSAPSPRTSRA